jgi:hypothetical protein
LCLPVQVRALTVVSSGCTSISFESGAIAMTKQLGLLSQASLYSTARAKPPRDYGDRDLVNQVVDCLTQLQIQLH